MSKRNKLAGILSVVDICSVGLFYSALLVNYAVSEEFFSLMVFGFILSAAAVAVYSVFTVINLITKNNQKTKLIFAAHIINIIWIISIIFLLKSVKIMGSPLF